MTVVFKKSSSAQAQINMQEMDTYIHDTMLIEPTQFKLIETLPVEVQKTVTFKPKTDGFKTYYFATGKKFRAGIVKDNKPEGEWTSWYPSGHVHIIMTFKDGRNEGPYESWFENGKINAKGQYKNDLREGTWVIYSKDGLSKRNVIYKGGELIK